MDKVNLHLKSIFLFLNINNTKIQRGKQFRVFISGDYELLLKMFRISGAAGMRTLKFEICTYFLLINQSMLQ